MLSHPALFPALVRSNAERKALFAEKNVSAVSGVDRNNGVILGELADIALFGVNIAVDACRPRTQSFDVAQNVEHLLTYAGHNSHVENNIH